MNPQIQQTLIYIEENYHEEFDIKSLSKIAGYSQFHFSRIFKVHVGESVMDYITRLKIEKSSLHIISKSSIIDTALNFGYKTPNGYNKAFKKAFGVSPTTYKKNKINFFKTFKGKLMNTPKIVQLKEKHIVYERVIGAYENSDSAWIELSKKLNHLGEKNIQQDMTLLQEDAQYYGICHDDPTVVKANNIRYDAAISWEKEKIDFLANNGFTTKILEAGKYAMVSFQGDPSKNLDTWFALYNWCEENDYEFKDLPPFEKYTNIIETMNEPEKQITEIYIPLK